MDMQRRSEQQYQEEHGKGKVGRWVPKEETLAELEWGDYWIFPGEAAVRLVQVEQAGLLELERLLDCEGERRREGINERQGRKEVIDDWLEEGNNVGIAFGSIGYEREVVVEGGPMTTTCFVAAYLYDRYGVIDLPEHPQDTQDCWTREQ